MSTIVGRFVQAQALGAAVCPDVFARTVFIVCEIDEAAANIDRLLTQLKIARLEQNAAAMRQAASDLAKIFGQGHQLASTIERVLSAETQR